MYYKGPKKDQIAWLKDIGRCDEDKVTFVAKLVRFGLTLIGITCRKRATAFPNGKKPIAFIQRMLQLATKSSDKHIVLDFFAGSGSTAHAVLANNEQDGGNRRWILVQLPEPSDIENLATISQDA